MKTLNHYGEISMQEIAFTYEELINNDDELLKSLITRENVEEIIKVVQNTIKYLTRYTLIFLQEINGRWYVN